MEELRNSSAIQLLGIEILGTSILSVNASPEMARALETETRENLQQQADQAIYEKKLCGGTGKEELRETELNTEIAVEEKQKQIAEKRMETEVQRSDNERKLREMQLASRYFDRGTA